MAVEKPARQPIQAATYLGIRLPGQDVSGPIPTADRVRMHDPTGRSPYVELYWRDWLVGYAPSEDA